MASMKIKIEKCDLCVAANSREAVNRSFYCKNAIENDHAYGEPISTTYIVF